MQESTSYSPVADPNRRSTRDVSRSVHAERDSSGGILSEEARRKSLENIYVLSRESPAFIEGLPSEQEALVQSRIASLISHTDKAERLLWGLDHDPVLVRLNLQTLLDQLYKTSKRMTEIPSCIDEVIKELEARLRTPNGEQSPTQADVEKQKNDPDVLAIRFFRKLENLMPVAGLDMAGGERGQVREAYFSTPEFNQEVREFLDRPEVAKHGVLFEHILSRFEHIYPERAAQVQRIRELWGLNLSQSASTGTVDA